METANASLTRKVTLLEDDLDRTEGEQPGYLCVSRPPSCDAMFLHQLSLSRRARRRLAANRPGSQNPPSHQCHRLLLLVRLLTSDALDIAAHDNGTTLPRRLLYLQGRANTLANKLESTEREAEQIGRAQASLSREEGAAQERAETLEAQLKTVQVV